MFNNINGASNMKRYNTEIFNMGISNNIIGTHAKHDKEPNFFKQKNLKDKNDIWAVKFKQNPENCGSW